MKKISLILGSVLFLFGCTTHSGSLETLFASYDEDEKQSAPAQEYADAEQIVVEESEVVEAVPAEKAAEPQVVFVEEAEPNRYRHNVALKAHNADFVSYEYKNIRIDELAALAIRYCDEQGGKKAYLRQIVLHQNHNRIATFDCKNLAMGQ